MTTDRYLIYPVKTHKLLLEHLVLNLSQFFLFFFPL